MRHDPVTIAVLGGGQLGQMLGLAGVPLGLRFRFLDPSADAPAAAVGALVVGALGDAAALDAVAEGATVVTYEWEGVPADAAAALGRRVVVYPPARALAVAQDRLTEKTLFERLGIPTAAFVPVHDRAGLTAAVDRIGLPAVLKTRSGGYDGKGQRVLHEHTDLDRAWAALGAVPLLLEAFVTCSRELSVLAARSVDGSTACWPAVENRHEHGILRVTRAPAPELSAELDRAARQHVARLLDELEYVGVLALELFETSGRLLANEIAPRVHNSGHWTIEGSATSQFENHLRAVLGWPVGSTEALGVAAMMNCIGALPDPDLVLAVDGAHLHRYGKAVRPGRKVGHVTVVAPDSGALAVRLDALRAVLQADDG